MIRIGREIQCLPYAEFFFYTFSSKFTFNSYVNYYMKDTIVLFIFG